MKIPNNYWYLLAILLCIPAFFINLDLLTLNEDEAIRALVALEMKLSGDYITPTLNNTLYYAKPPLYNWILNISYFLSGASNELALRIPTIFFLGLFAYSIFYYSNKYYDREYAFINAFLFLTCGRVLFWDSMLAYIDICYSWITFMNLMVIFHYFQKDKLRRLFLLSYFLAAIGFMLKGFPSLLFQGLTLLVFFGYKKQFKKLLSRSHFLAISLFIILVASYYLYYFNLNPTNKAIDGLLDQSTRRTLMHDKHDIYDFLIHLVTYPFENIYHFLPCSVMIIYIFKKDFITKILKNEFLKYCAIIFGVNILVYWISIEVYPRYILMLVPLFFSILLFLHKEHFEKNTYWYKGFIVSSFLFILLGAGLSISMLFWSELNEVKFSTLKSLIVFTPICFLAYYFLRHKSQRLLVLICTLLVIRIGFNFFVLPDRYENDKATIYKIQAVEIGKKYMNEDLRLFENSKVDYTSSFYISSTRNQITKRDFEHQNKNVYYIIDKTIYEIPDGFTEIEDFQVREGDRILTIIKKT